MVNYKLKKTIFDNVGVVEFNPGTSPLDKLKTLLEINSHIAPFNKKVIEKLIELHEKHGVEDVDSAGEWLLFSQLETAEIEWDDLHVHGSEGKVILELPKKNISVEVLENA